MERADTIIYPSIKASFSIFDTNDDKFYLKVEAYKEQYYIDTFTKYLLEIIDGKTTVDELLTKVKKQFDADFTIDEVQGFIEYWEKKGVLIYHGNVSKVKKKTYLPIQISIFSNSIVSKISNIFTPLYTKFFYIHLTAIFTACLVSLLSFGNFLKDWFSPSNTSSVLELIIPFFILLIVPLFHELGHAAATKKHGIPVGKIGFGLYLYFMPVFFSDVTDIWRLSKKERIKINLAGVFIDYHISFLFFIIAFIFQSQWLLLAGTLVFISTFYQFIPLLRYDGYWILVDLLDEPGFIKKANDSLSAYIDGIIANRIVLLDSKKRFLILYSLMSKLFLYSLLFTTFVLTPFPLRKIIDILKEVVVAIINDPFVSGSWIHLFTTLYFTISLSFFVFIALQLVYKIIKAGVRLGKKIPFPNTLNLSSLIIFFCGAIFIGAALGKILSPQLIFTDNSSLPNISSDTTIEAYSIIVISYIDLMLGGLLIMKFRVQLLSFIGFTYLVGLFVLTFIIPHQLHYFGIFSPQGKIEWLLLVIVFAFLIYLWFSKLKESTKSGGKKLFFLSLIVFFIPQIQAVQHKKKIETIVNISKEEEITDIKQVVKLITDLSTINSTTDQKHLFFLFSYDCEDCWDGIANIEKQINATTVLDTYTAIGIGTRADQEVFQNKLNPKFDYLHLDIQSPEFEKLSPHVKEVPLSIYTYKGNIIYYSFKKTISPQTLSQILH